MESNEQYKFPLYRLKKDIPLAKAGTIFYYDCGDSDLGSSAEGCLKMAWTRTGNCQNGLCADTIVFHADAIDAAYWFEEIDEEIKELFTPSGVELNGEILYRKTKE